MIQKGNIKLSESIRIATEDLNIGQISHFNEMTNKEHNQFMKTYKMASSFVALIFLHYLILLCLSLELLFLFCFYVPLHQDLFLRKLVLFHLNLFLELLINLILGPFSFFLETLLSIYTILPNPSYLILLVTFQLKSNITLFGNLSCRLNPSLLIWTSHRCLCVDVLMRVNVAKLVLWHPHVSFLAKPLFYRC